MANSKITIEFLQIPSNNYTVNFAETNLSLSFLERFKTSRVQSNQVKIPTSFNIGTVENPEIVWNGTCAQNFKTAFDLDYNSTNLFSALTFLSVDNNGLGTIVIQANYENAVFTYIDDGLGVVDVTIENQEEVIPFEITNISFSEASNPCNKVEVSIETSELATIVESPITINPNTDNPIVFEILRGQSYTIGLKNASNFSLHQNLVAPDILNASNFTINVTNSPNGATLSITNINSNGLELEYSLNNVDWQTENTFTGLENGNYTLYVRDQLGCSFTKDFNVNELALYIPHFYISKSNSIRYAQRINFGDAGNYKNDENTLSCEANVILPYKELQLFQSADTIKTQFQTNYSTLTAKVIKEDNTEVDIPIVKKSNNIGIKDKRDAVKYNFGNGKTGIYFLSGNIYNYDTGLANGTHTLNGNLPEWAIVGNYINIGLAWYLIEDKIYVEEKNADVIVINEIYTGAETNTIVGCVYNLFNYDVYEYEVDFSDYLEEKIRVRLVCEDDNFETITHLSEEIYVKVRHENTLDIDYWNEDNNDVFYATGIRHGIRIPFYKIEGKTNDESENNITDTNVVLLNSELYEGDSFTFEPLTKEMWRKLMMALSHENVFIDGVQYVKNGEFETEGPLEDTNLYVLTAKMIKAGKGYNSKGSSILSGSSSQTEIPGILEGDAGFIKY